MHAQFVKCFLHFYQLVNYNSFKYITKTTQKSSSKFGPDTFNYNETLLSCSFLCNLYNFNRTTIRLLFLLFYIQQIAEQNLYDGEV